MNAQLDSSEQARDYDRIWEELSETDYQKQQHFKNRLLAIEWALRKHDVSASKILEVGCGFGTISNVLGQYGEVTGVDLSPRAIEIAEERYPEAEFEAGDITDNTIASGQFDVLVTTEVIEHVPREARELFMESLAQRLKTGGLLVLTTPNKRLSDRIETFQLIEEHFFENELRELLSKHFEIEHLTTVHRMFPVSGNKSRVLQAVRAGCYEVLKLRGAIEAPARTTNKGMYFLVIAKKKGRRTNA